MTDKHMYEDDTPKSGEGSAPRQDLLAEILHSPELRPQVGPETVARLVGRLQRTAPGYSPRPAHLLDWVKERLFIPSGQWKELIDAIERDHGPIELNADKLIQLDGGVAALEEHKRIASTFSGAAVLFGQEPIRAPSLGDPAEHLSSLLRWWIRFIGPFTVAEIRDLLPNTRANIEEALELLAQEQVLVRGQLVRGQPEQLCDAENFEILLRMERAASRPQLEVRPIRDLQHFIAHHQGLCSPGVSIDDLQARIGQLMGYPARAEAWEEHILPARIQPYNRTMIDSLLQEGELACFGAGSQRLSFAFSEELSLFRTRLEDSKLPEVFTLPQLQKITGSNSADATAELWDRLWSGELVPGSFAQVRRGVEAGFKAEPASAGATGSRRRGFNRWKSTRPMSGIWRSVPKSAQLDALDKLELDKERVRQLLDRYGILTRDLLRNELEELRWSKLFRAMRLMELSGEIFSGIFFEDHPGPHFISHEALRALKRPLDKDRIYWLNATDPASCAGIKELGLPTRLKSTWLVFKGPDLLAAILKSGKELELGIGPDHPDLPRCIEVFKVLLTRSFRPLALVELEKINGEPALKSDYAEVLRGIGFKKDYRSLTLRRSY